LRALIELKLEFVTLTLHGNVTFLGIVYIIMFIRIKFHTLRH